MPNASGGSGLARALAAAMELEGGARAAGGEAGPEPVVAPAGAVGLAAAEPYAAELLSHLRAGPAVERAEVVGAVRRRCATVSGIELLAVSARPEGVSRHFVSWPGAESAGTVDATRSWVRLPSGIRAELRVVPRRCFGATLQYLTGSEAHNVALRQLGLQHGIRLSEYGVFRLEQARAGARRIGGQRELDVFEALGMPWIPPELRENRGELEAALRDELPVLVTREALHGDTDVRAAARGELSELVRACAESGYAYCVVGMRAPAAGRRPRHGRSARDELTAASAAVPGMHVVAGIRAGIAEDGSLDTEAEPLPGDIVIGSVPATGRLSGVRLSDRLLRALEQPRLDVLAGLNDEGRRGPAGLAVDEILRQAARHGVAIELSGRPGVRGLSEASVRLAAELGVPVALASGARTAQELDRIRYAVDRARRGWIPASRVVNAGPLRRWRDGSPAARH
jgi:DNA polymerase (family X)